MQNNFCQFGGSRTFVACINISSNCHNFYHTQDTLRRSDATPSLGTGVDTASEHGAIVFMAKNSTASLSRWLRRHGYDADGFKINKPGSPKKKKNPYGLVRKEERLIKCVPLVASRQSVGASPGEKAIQDILIKNNIRFIPEHHFNYCYSRKTNSFLFFDFFLPDHNAVIEFDGIHHYKPIYGEDRLKQQKYRDRVKNRYCQKKGIKMLRIPCFRFDEAEAMICEFFDKYDL